MKKLSFEGILCCTRVFAYFNEFGRPPISYVRLAFPVSLGCNLDVHVTDHVHNQLNILNNY